GQETLGLERTVPAACLTHRQFRLGNYLALVLHVAASPRGSAECYSLGTVFPAAFQFLDAQEVLTQAMGFKLALPTYIEPIEHPTERGRAAWPLRIAITVDPEIPVPPVLYGGIERIVDMLVRGLVHRGHEVTLFANSESQVACRLLPYPALHSQKKADTLKNMWHVTSHVWRSRVDVVHSFARLAYLTPLLP